MERIQRILRRMQRKVRRGQTVQEAIDTAFRRFDTSHDGSLQFGEFYNGECTVLAPRGACPACRLSVQLSSHICNRCVLSAHA